MPRYCITQNVTIALEVVANDKREARRKAQATATGSWNVITIPKEETRLISIPERVGIPRRLLRPKIVASCHSDDSEVIVSSFDATPWFARASDGDIRDLLAQNCIGRIADRIAGFAVEYDAQVLGLFSHLAERSKNTAVRDFTCTIDQESAREWLTIHRPHLLTGQPIFLRPRRAGENPSHRTHPLVQREPFHRV